jgi:hypothetical protein
LTPFFWLWFVFSMLVGVARPAIANRRGASARLFLIFYYFLCACGHSSTEKLCSLPLQTEMEEGELQFPFFCFCFLCF